ncbi:hypothetical protein D187_007122 [Cystobacter fuscus DSM 2262]|uniref:Uncharacterized protein n=1 Tax=Cystobacter fuscus (strain ATCC 25194 / DSM 2262 / NBRC 100088 / M29) TaxID=1242864 RepID=S9QLI5_CYSF2|nr:hypothetical protein [Cystobacter fuscus]EPX57368.1 hypothetical protein D187_007122 [Cystobacter fuscus DSM 2262]
MSAPAPQTPTSTHASEPAQAQQVGSHLAFPPDPSTMSNLTQQHGSLQAKLTKLEQRMKQARMGLETLGALTQGLQELGDAIKTTSAKEKVTPAELLGLSTLVLKNATNIDHAFQVFKQS